MATLVPTLVLIILLPFTASSTPRIEIDKGSCRFFYAPDNTYTISFFVEIFNESNAGEILRNIQISDNLVTTFGASSRILGARIDGWWGDQGSAYGVPWNWDWSNFTNWNGTTTTNLFNNGNQTISNLELRPGGYIHLELCVRVRADNTPTGIGSGNNWTNTASFVSAQTTTGINLTGANVVNTRTPGTTNAVTVTPRRSRAILTTGVIATSPSPGGPPTNFYEPAVSLDGTHSFFYFIKIKNHPQVVANPDGGSLAANSIESYLDLDYSYQNLGIPVQSLSLTKIYGPASISLNPAYTGRLNTIGGSAVTPDGLAFTGSLGVNDSALFRVNIVAGPTSNDTTTLWNGAWTRFRANGVYQELPSSTQDTINNAFDQCHCYGFGVNFKSLSNITLAKSVSSSSCVAGQNNRQDVTFQFTVTGNATNNVWLRNLQLLDNLNTPSCGSFQGIVSGPTIVSSTANTTPALNLSFNGNTVTNLFNGSFNDRLGPGENIVVRVTARYNVWQMCSPNQFNAATAIGAHPGGRLFQSVVNNILIPRTNCCIMTASLGPPQTACPGNSIGLSPTISNGTAAYSYNWSSSLGTAASVTVSPATTTTYTVTVTDAATCTSTPTVTITVVADPTVSITGAANACVGGSIVLTANVAGGSGANTFQWQRRIAPAGPWTNVGTNSPTYSTDNGLGANAYDYQVIVSQSAPGCGNTSAAIAANVVADPTVSITSTSGEVCVGGGVALTATGSGGTGACSLQWQSNTGSGWNDISGATSTNYTTPALSANTTYRVVYSCTGAGCCN